MPPNRPLGLLRLPEQNPSRALFNRIALAVGLIVLVSLGLWLDRNGLKDQLHPDRPIRFVDVFYFTVVSLTTVGYGDIVPVTGFARFVNAVFLTPVRLVVWAIFLGTAYELVLLRTRESFRMRQLKNRLTNHIIVCGFGVRGQAALSELRAHGHLNSEIVVIELSEEAAARATSEGLPVLVGDASHESVLQAASIEDAGHILVSPHSDDQCVLICLTVRALNSKVRLIAAAREEENIKLIYRAGADVVVAPAVTGGRLMGAAVQQVAVPRFLNDLLTYGEGLEAAEYHISAAEAGKTWPQIGELEDKLVLGIARDENSILYDRCRELPLQAGDIVVYLRDGDGLPRRNSVSRV
ncbi:potassium channel protein [bacterium]|nr:MAG: potassium channel protein [bacterium]